ncbi:hypothetical protein [Coralloluteibacterium stylophorae]|uniref:General secretion pathway protein GspN n=1 Tax=Coralloluteibacterium stylophorae TaxID=1776034 RepID=A0A8J7VS53_9GAMM|nr:hypothetical protein [Coralloluteibacterium stylophorae]MBS7457773.1 hypothetical protein [Coralloluteibacterium stylophorae]
MRSDLQTPGMWIAAALAAWALLAALLAAAGLGTRVAPLPDDAALLPPLPRAAAGAAATALPVDRAEIAARPLFSPDRRPQDGPAEPRDAAPPLDLVLTGVILTPRLRMAILSDRQDRKRVFRVPVGQPLEGAPDWSLLELAPREAVLAGPEGESRLRLEVYDGQGGEPPTALQAPAAPREDRLDRARGLTPDELAARAAELERARREAEEGRRGAPESEEDNDEADAGPSPEEQAERIRRRIQERREQLRRQREAQASDPNANVE